MHWDTYLKEIRLLNGASKIEVGVDTLVVARDGVVMQTLYTAFDRPNKVAVVLSGRNRILRSFHGEWIFTALIPDGTRLSITYTYNLRFPFNALAGIVHNRLVRDLQARLALLKVYVGQAGENRTLYGRMRQDRTA
jgi:hypothetical protein